MAPRPAKRSSAEDYVKRTKKQGMETIAIHLQIQQYFRERQRKHLPLSYSAQPCSWFAVTRRPRVGHCLREIGS
jgi:hypothetical protein